MSNTPALPAWNGATLSEMPTTPAHLKSPVRPSAARYSSPSRTATPSPPRPQKSAAPARDLASAVPRTVPPPPALPAPAFPTLPASGSLETNSIRPVATGKMPGSFRTFAARSSVWVCGPSSPEKVPQCRSAGNWRQRTKPPALSRARCYPLSTPLSSVCLAAPRNSPLATPAATTKSRALAPATSRCTNLRIR